jgi:DNA-binding transcriptional regulator YhcF (GntR family)
MQRNVPIEGSSVCVPGPLSSGKTRVGIAERRYIGTMTRTSASSFIRLDDHSATPKYQQLVNSIMRAVQTGQLKKDDVLPSINELSFEYEISRDTAEKGYRQLKKMGLLSSVPGKGYFIKSTEIDQTLRVFLLFNKLSAHKKIIYDALVGALSDKAFFDFYIYNNDFSLFKKLLLNRKQEYTHYVIIPHFIEGGEKAVEVINTIDKDKLIILDKLVPGVTGQYRAAYENFEKDIYTALEQALEQLQKYREIRIVFPENSYYPHEIILGFERFCAEYAFAGKVVHRIEEDQVSEGVVYIILMEDDLAKVIEAIIEKKFQVGKDVGVISYNETPLKRIILNGITTISTDYQMLGETTAQLILDKTPRHIEMPFYLTLRPSL